MKKKPKLGISDDLPEGIYGLTANEARLKRKQRIAKLKEKPKPKIKVLPSLALDYSKVLPAEAKNLNLDNVVGIPEELLKKIKTKLERKTTKLNSIILESIVPSLLAYDAASNYTKATLRDGLNLDVDIDTSALEAAKELIKLDILFFYIKNMSLPMSYKRKLLDALILKLAEASVEKLKKTARSDAMSAHIRELQGVLLRRSENKPKNKLKKAKISGIKKSRIT